MISKPQYTITVNAADYLTKIAEAVTRLEYSTGFKRNIKLHRENRVRSIYSSLAIEGYMLTLGEVTDVIDGKLVAGKQTEPRGVTGEPTKKFVENVDEFVEKFALNDTHIGASKGGHWEVKQES